MAFLLAISLYLLTALVLGLIPVHRECAPVADGVDIYVATSGVHVDIGVPYRHPCHDWSRLIAAQDFPQPAGIRTIFFGWGDQGFFLETPTWGDLSLGTAVRAMWWWSPSAMHVTAYDFAPVTNENLRRIRISTSAYQRLVGYVEASFAAASEGQFVPLPDPGYNDQNDRFYRAVGSYNIFRTCNEWAAGGLRAAGVRAPVWSPFAVAVRHHLPDPE
jgi:uncharacterized protein (TIGR02117 family)